eukprot:254931_1
MSQYLQFSLLVISYTLVVNSQLQCAAETSYCLTGLKLTDPNSFICSQYIYQGIRNSCSYFKSIAGRYLLWNSQYNVWDITDDIDGNLYTAYCEQPILDNCVGSTWTYYDGENEYIQPTLEIKTCVFDNTECLASYKNNDTYCIGNTIIDANKGIAGKHWFKGCSMTKPYFVENNTNTTIGWDDILSAWYIAEEISSTYFSYAYCRNDDITECNEHWYVYEGSKHVLDKTVISGYCDTCLEEKYDKICIIGGISPNLMIGEYEFEKCHNLFQGFRMIGPQNDYTVFYSIYQHEIIVGINYALMDARCNGSEWESCIGVSDVWSVWNSTSDTYDLQNRFDSGDCSDVDNQCHGHYDYCMDIYDDIDIEFAGVYQYEICDDNGYPIFYQYKNMNGLYGNFSMIIFDYNIKQYRIISRGIVPDQYAICNGLLLDSCNDGFWLPAARNFSLYKCNESQKDTKTVWESYWYIFVICSVVLIFGCCIVICCHKKKRTIAELVPLMKNKDVNDNEKELSTVDGIEGERMV